MTRHPISCAKLAAAYGVTAERARQLVAQFGFETVADPGRLYDQLLQRGNASRLRSLLSNADRRTQISLQLQ